MLVLLQADVTLENKNKDFEFTVAGDKKAVSQDQMTKSVEVTKGTFQFSEKKNVCIVIFL